MKRILALALSLMLATTMLGSACAEQPEPADDAALKAEQTLDEKQEEETLRAASRSDVVEIDGNKYAVMTGENIGIAYEIMDDNVYVLTQDYVRQAELYGKFYNDPLSAASKFVKNGMHLNIYDAANKVDVYIYVSTADWAMLYPDTEKLTEDSVALLKSYFRRNGLDNADNEVFGIAGNNHYFFYNCKSTDGMVYMYTSVGGYMVQIRYEAKTDEQVSRGLELLDDLAIVAM